MREDPGLDMGAITHCLGAHYGLSLASVRYLPLGYDPNASVYQVLTADSTPYFLKVRFGPIDESSLLVPWTLIDRGVPNILGPLRTRSSALWAPLDGYPGHTVVLYPFVPGENAMVAGMSDDQWREFGSTLRAMHDSGLEDTFRGQLRIEDFALPSAVVIRQLLTLVNEKGLTSAAAARFARFWRQHAGRLHSMLARAEALGRSLRSQPFELVLCHADIHAANILVGDDGQITLIDWDGPLIAPRERDLLFIVGSRIARVVEPREEDLFFEGYGPVAVDPSALVYYRYERIIEDIGEIGKSVFLDPDLSEQARTEEAELAMSFFAPGGDADLAETVPGRRWPGDRA
ncbi:MAG: phosphotransferase [Chloroflexi bacterium]|nr:phosphotransferase [Chloroflexota bacterium]